MRYLVESGPAPTTAAFAKLALVASTIKTVLQVKPLIPCRVIEWGASFDASAAATPGQVELCDTGAVAATVTASVAGDIGLYDLEAYNFNAPATHLSLGASATGYNASAEGTITAVREMSAQLIAPTNQFVQQFPLGREPQLIVNNLTRIRMTFGAAVNLYAYMILEF